MTARAALMPLIVLGGCVFSKLDYEGKRCDPADGCPAPWTCGESESGWVCKSSPVEECNGLDDDGNGKTDDRRGCIVTLAGSGTPALRDGPSGEAAFAGPQYLTAAPDGGYYVADGHNHAVRRVLADGTVETIAGTGKCGFVDGPVATAQFCLPIEVAVAADGALLVSDSLNHRIRKIAGGSVTTLAGTGEAGFRDSASGGDAKLNQPSGLDLMPDGGLLVADTSNHRIRQIDIATGAVTTFLGSGEPGFLEGGATVMQLSSPRDVLWSGGNVFIAEDARLRRFIAGGSGTVSGSMTGQRGDNDGAGAGALFNGLRQLTLTTGFFYVADFGNHSIRRIAGDGTTVTMVGKDSQGFRDGHNAPVGGDFPVLTEPAGLIRLGNAWLLTDANHRIRKLEGTEADNTITTLTGGRPEAETADGRLSMTSALVLASDGTLVWTEPNRHLLRRLNRDGGVETLVGLPGTATAGFVNGSVNQQGAGLARLNVPTALAAHADGRLFIADLGNNVIRVVTPSGAVETFAADAGFSRPSGLGLTPPEVTPPALYVADTGTHTLRRVRLDTGSVERVAGVSGVDGTADGDLDVGRLQAPGALTVTRSGDVFVVDGYVGRTIRQISPAGRLSTAFTNLPVSISALVEADADAGTLFAVGRERIFELRPSTGAVVDVFPRAGRINAIGMQDGDAETGAGLWFLTGIAVTPEAFFLADGHSRRIRQLWR